MGRTQVDSSVLSTQYTYNILHTRTHVKHRRVQRADLTCAYTCPLHYKVVVKGTKHIVPA